MKNPVGPVLRMGDEVELIVAAIEEDNPGTEIEVIDRGAYVRVQGEDQITVTQETLRRHLGADYEIRSFGGIMSAFSGLASATADTSSTIMNVATTGTNPVSVGILIGLPAPGWN